MWACPLAWPLPLTRLLQSKPVTKERERLRQRQRETDREMEREPYIFCYLNAESLTTNSALFNQLDARP